VTEGKKVKVFTNDSGEFKGKMYFYNDDKVIIETDTIELENISNIRVRNITHIPSGATLVGAGVFVTYTGLNLFVQTLAQGDIAIMIGTIVGVPLALSGVSIVSAGVLIVCLARNYYSTDRVYCI